MTPEEKRIYEQEQGLLQKRYAQMVGEEPEKQSGSEVSEYEFDVAEKGYFHLKVTKYLSNVSSIEDYDQSEVIKGPMGKVWVKNHSVIKLDPIRFANMQRRGFFENRYDEVVILHNPKKEELNKAKQTRGRKSTTKKTEA